MAYGKIPAGGWALLSVGTACLTYAYKGNSVELNGPASLSLKIDTQTTTLLTKLNDMEKKIDGVIERVAKLEIKVSQLENLHLRNTAAIDILAKDKGLSEDDIADHFDKIYLNQALAHIKPRKKE